MKAFVITLRDNEYSNGVTYRCIQTAKNFGNIDVERFFGIDKEHAYSSMEGEGLKWTWANNNTTRMICPHTGLQQFPYAASDLRAKIGCSMSHYWLWKKCVELNEPILILEHDVVFIRPFVDFEFNGICQINDPSGATRKGSWWSQQMKSRGGEGAFKKTLISNEIKFIPDGLAGNSAYVIKPWAAQELINKFKEVGVWPNDATMCIQLFPYLEEHYPFITKVEQTKSTSTT